MISVHTYAQKSVCKYTLFSKNSLLIEKLILLFEILQTLNEYITQNPTNSFTISHKLL